MAFHHVVLFTMKPGTSSSDEAVVRRALDQLGDESGALNWNVVRSLDERKGTVIAEIAEFADERAFEHFRASPAHQTASQIMSRVTDWVVADFWSF